ncbi:multidrug ABC transporter ATPase [Flammeovirgaceae bacterium 311]|nr:multidrug ABC transporter ATPase [Flammeovirgaceae bacterium 311]
MAWSILKNSEDSQDSANGRKLNSTEPSYPYTLVFLDAAKNAPQGTEKVIDAPYISIGRDSDCLISYGDEFPMVSRLHAAIEWSEDSYSIRHLSNTNQTLLNDRPIARKWFLRDDDVIQLAPSGPKIKFKLPMIINTRPPKKGSSGSSKLDLHNIALITVIVLAVLLTVLMVYLTVGG